MRTRESGFSLLEVLAAVTLLIVLFIPLGRAAIDGLRSEGESRRRLEASLLADDALAKIESGLSIGTVPEIGENANEEREFRIVTSVTSFQLPFAINEETEPQRGVELAQSLFPAPNSRQPSPLLKIEIRVSWPGPGGAEDRFDGDDAEHESRVTRTTFAFDFNGVADKLAVLQLAGQGEPGLEDLLQ